MNVKRPDGPADGMRARHARPGSVISAARRHLQARAGRLLLCALTMLPLAAPAATAGAGAVVKTDQVRAELVAHAPEGVGPGKPLQLGLKLEHAPHWHTYWKNPGDSGLPTTMAFELPPGFTAGEIDWPTPKALPVGPLMNFGYEGTLLLPVGVKVPAGFAGDSLTVKLRADWLICKDVCIPEGGDFELKVPAQAATAIHGNLFEAARQQMPQEPAGTSASAEVGPGGLEVRLQGLPADWQGRALRFFPETAGVIDNAARPAARWQDGAWQARVALSPQRSESPAAMPVVLVADGEAAGIRVTMPVRGTWPAPGGGAPTANAPAPAIDTATTPAAANAATPAPTLGYAAALMLAFVGGLLLNLMPCVFPVLSLKVLGFAAHAGDRRAHLTGGLAYTVGVVLSFLALAGLLLALRAAGEQIGWGFQLQSPVVVAALAVLFTVIGLNLAGVFEVGSVLPGSWAAARARHPLVDAGLTGVLAVAVASPCTAPFMGASLGLAVTLPPLQALLLFGVLGLGMAAPYLAASAWPAVARALPRPGAWMTHLRTALAFPMWATVIWLLWVLGHQAGVDAVAALLGGLLALSFAVWVLGSASLGRTARRVLGGLASLVLAATLAWAWPALRSDAIAGAAPAGAAAVDSRWQPWSVERVNAALADGRPVFVDFTAAWCVTCQFNKRTVLNDTSVMADFAQRQVVLLRADWTRRDPAITAELARMGRNGVPVYALHTPGSTGPQLLSEILTVRAMRETLGALR